MLGDNKEIPQPINRCTDNFGTLNFFNFFTDLLAVYEATGKQREKEKANYFTN